jgi:hypothetical protein
MRLKPYVAIGLLTLCVFGTVGCTKSSPPEQANATTSISVDMPRDQTLQFLKQSATTLKLSATTTATNDSITAGSSKAVLSGPDVGPVTVVFTGDAVATSKWSAMVMDKLPSKKL